MDTNRYIYLSISPIIMCCDLDAVQLQEIPTLWRSNDVYARDRPFSGLFLEHYSFTEKNTASQSSSTASMTAVIAGGDRSCPIWSACAGRSSSRLRSGGIVLASDLILILWSASIGRWRDLPPYLPKLRTKAPTLHFRSYRVRNRYLAIFSFKLLLLHSC